MTDYNIIIKQMEALAEEDRGYIPVMANASALLFHSMDDINWAGFYFVKNDSGIVALFGEENAIIAASLTVLIAGLIVSFIILARVQKKYNGGFF